MGVSFDSTEKNQAWAVQEGFQYELWTDQNRDLAVYYGAASSPASGSASRYTYILDAEGDLVLEYRSVNAGAHPGEVLLDCRALFGGG